MKKTLMTIGVILTIGVLGVYLAIRMGYINTSKVEFLEEMEFKTLHEPEPVVVRKFESTDKSTLLKGIATVYAEIRNDGGSGLVDIEVKLRQDERVSYREYQRFIKSGSILKLEVDFDEYRQLKGGATYEVLASASKKQPSPYEIKEYESRQ